jgi:FdhD protein
VKAAGPPSVIATAPSTAVRQGAAAQASRDLAEETPVALVYDGSTEAVMLATPQDLSDFALGFSLTEGLIVNRDEITHLEVLKVEGGMEARIWLAPERSQAAAARRRARMGPTGCGLCGVESLAEANRAVPVVPNGVRLTSADVLAARAALDQAAKLGTATRATHAAGFWTKADGLVLVREDVGRHNALDKLAGAMALAGIDAGTGAVVLTSRVSLEMAQKTAMIGASVLIAMSAPTALAVRVAEASGLTLVAVARADGFEVFTHPKRIECSVG